MAGTSGHHPSASIVTVSSGDRKNVREKPASPSGIVTAPSDPEPGKSATDDAPTSGPGYRIGPEDVLQIDVWGNVALSGTVTVRPDGKISMPLIQDVQAEGVTAVELSGVIRRKLLPFVRDPRVAVIVTQINAPKVFVIGNVARPGSYPLRGDMSVLEALTLAGGFTPFASPRNITVLRNKGGNQETRKVNYYDMLRTDEKGSYGLQAGDTIVVP